jgi:hypothetical protein
MLIKSQSTSSGSDKPIDPDPVGPKVTRQSSVHSTATKIPQLQSAVGKVHTGGR